MKVLVGAGQNGPKFAVVLRVRSRSTSFRRTMSKWWRAAASNLRPAAETLSRSYHTIQAIPREITGTRVSIKDRAQGRIPAVVFAKPNPNDGGARVVSRKHLLTTERRQIQSILDSIDLPYFCSTTFPLQIRAGSGSSVLLESGNVLPVNVHRDPKTGKVLNLVFMWADEGQEMKVNVPVVFKGEDACLGLKKGGHLHKMRTSLKFLCPPEHIPQKIEVDISNLDIGDKVRVKDIEVPPAMKFLTRNEKLLCKIVATESESSQTAKKLSTETDNSESSQSGSESQSWRTAILHSRWLLPSERFTWLKNQPAFLPERKHD